MMQTSAKEWNKQIYSKTKAKSEKLKLDNSKKLECNFYQKKLSYESLLEKYKYWKDPLSISKLKFEIELFIPFHQSLENSVQIHAITLVHQKKNSEEWKVEHNFL